MCDAVETNRYVTVRSHCGRVFMNVIHYNGDVSIYGQHGYSHKRSARRAAIALAKKLDISYRQDLEYVYEPHAFVAEATV